jgi:hypothetical protein
MVGAVQLFAKIFDRLLQTVGQLDAWHPVEVFASPRYVRLTTLRIVFDRRHLGDFVLGGGAANLLTDYCGEFWGNVTLRVIEMFQKLKINLPSMVCSTGLPMLMGCV